MNEREQLELAMELSRVEHTPTQSYSSDVKTPIKPFPALEHNASSHAPVKARNNIEAPKATHTAVGNNKTNTGGANDELEEALKLSLEEFESARKRQDHTINTDNDFQKALELSKMEYEQLREGPVKEHHGKNGKTLFYRDTERSTQQKGTLTSHEENGDNDLQKALELSKVECKQLAELDNTDPEPIKEDDLAKALQLSRLDCKQLKETNEVVNLEDDMETALELSKKEGTGWQPLYDKKEQSRDGDLQRALELSRIEYTQSNHGKDERQSRLQSHDVIVLEESDDVLLSRDQDVTYPNHQSSLLPDHDSFVPSSVPSDHEWDPQSENQDKYEFDALNPVTITGNSKDSAILLDSQEPLEDTVDDFTYALKVQEELNKEINKGSSSHHESPRGKDMASPDLNKQLLGYRESQKEKYGMFSGRRDKSSRGLDFRRNVAAIACGKPVQIGIASPISRPGNSHKERESGRVLDDKPSSSSRIDRDKSCFLDSPKKHPFCRDGTIR